jgi:hypothetical protein
MFGIKEAVTAARALIELRDDYSNPPNFERGLDPLLYATLRASHPKVRVSRQEYVEFSKSSRPSRIDFRLGGTNPTVLEFAVRPPNGIQQLQGPQNHSELMKLSKIPNTRRILLLVDLRAKALSKGTLKATYDPLHAGRGKKERHPVTVVYVHRTNNFWFTWSPFD